MGLGGSRSLEVQTCNHDSKGKFKFQVTLQHFEFSWLFRSWKVGRFRLCPLGKEERVFQMVIVSVLPHAECGPNDHREGAPHFIKIELWKVLFRVEAGWSYWASNGSLYWNKTGSRRRWTRRGWNKNYWSLCKWFGKFYQKIYKTLSKGWSESYKGEIPGFRHNVCGRQPVDVDCIMST